MVFKSFDNKPCVTISMSTHFTYSASMGDELIGQPIIEKKNKYNRRMFCHKTTN